LAGQVEAAPLVVATQSVDRAALRYRLEGQEGLARWTGTLEAVRIAAPGWPLGGLSAAFTLDRAPVDGPRLTGPVAGAPRAGRGAWRWAGAGRAEADLGPVALAALPGRPPGLPLAGTGSGRVQATVERGAVSATGTIDLSDVALADVPLGAGSGRVGL